jgi:hypothetical protein
MVADQAMLGVKLLILCGEHVGSTDWACAILPKPVFDALLVEVVPVIALQRDEGLVGYILNSANYSRRVALVRISAVWFCRQCRQLRLSRATGPLLAWEDR